MTWLMVPMLGHSLVQGIISVQPMLIPSSQQLSLTLWLVAFLNF